MRSILTKLRSSVAYAPEGAGGGSDGGAGGDAAAAAAPADTGAVLYPDDKPAGDAAAGGDKPADDVKNDVSGKGDWAEYVPDPSKSDEENAAAKAEHDKTKPAEKVDPADTVPEDGKYEIKAPDGMEVDADLLAAVAPEFKAAGLTQRQAQALADKFSAHLQAQQEKATAAWTATTARWVDEAKADREIGGAKWDQTAKTASGVVARFGTPALKEYLNASGGGNHPDMIRFMAKVGAMISEDDPARSEAPGKKVAQDTASILYPDDQPKGR